MQVQCINVLRLVRLDLWSSIVHSSFMCRWQTTHCTRYTVIIHSHLWHAYFDKFWLYGGGMDAFVVQQRLDLKRNAPVVKQTATADMRRGDDTIARQLPHVKLMNIAYTFNLPTTAHITSHAERYIILTQWRTHFKFLFQKFIPQIN